MLRTIRTVCGGLALATLIGFNPAYAAPAGTVQTDFGGREGIMGTALQADGKLVAAGFFYGSSYDNSFALARYGIDGKLDATFGTGGKVLTTTFAATSGYAAQAEATAVAIQADGRIVAAGFTYTEDIALARYNTNGSLDTTFGSGGKVVTNWGSLNDYAFAVGIQSTGKIIVGGYANTNGTFDFVMTRYNSNGTVDATFGSNGTVFTDFSLSDDRIAALKVISGDKIVAVGRTGGNMAVARYTVNGALDTIFNNTGKMTTDFGGNYDEARAVAIDANGKIVVTGPAGVNGDIGLARYTTGGSLDSKFGSSGKVTTNLGGSDQSAAVAIDGSGKIVVGGYAGNGFEVLRYTSSGALDNTFGSSGRVTTRIGANPEEVWAIAVQGTQIIASGRTQSSTAGGNFALVRYNSNGTLDANFGAKADLVATVTSSPNPVLLGGIITYTITIGNNGPDAAEQVSLPASVGATTTQGSCAGGYCLLGTLNSGATATVTMTDTGDTTPSKFFTVQVDSLTADTNAANNTASVSTTVSGSANLTLAMTASPNPGKLQQDIIYTLTVRNLGPDASPNVTLTDDLGYYGPIGYYAAFVSATTSQGSCTGTLTCSLGSLASGATATVTVTIRPYRNGTFTNAATVSGIGDPDAANNTASVATTVNSSSDLAITISDSPDPVRVGNNVTYTVTLKNNGPDPAYGVLLRDYYQGYGITLISASSPDGSCNVSWCDFGTLASGQTVTATIVATMSRTGIVTNEVAWYTLGYAIPDPNPANDSATASTTVIGSADLSLTVTDSPDPVVVGNNLTYTYTIHNAGPDPSTYVSLGYTVPGANIVSISATQSTYCDVYSGCQIGTINSGATVTVTLVVSPTSTGTLTNTSTLFNSSVDDPNMANNSVTESTAVTGSADLAISMTDSPDPVRVNTNLTYTITVTNNGPNPSSQVKVTDVLPSGVSFVSSMTSLNYYCDNTAGTLTCDLGTLNSGASATATIVVKPTARGTVSNSASVNSAVTDPVTANNSTTASTSVIR